MIDTERELGWDDAIENDSPEFALLDEGDYDFEVTGMERQRYQGGAKLPPCNMAVLKIRVNAPDGRTAAVSHRLYLHTRTEGLLCAFFTAIGERKHGDRLVPNWNRVVGARGRCHVGVYTSNRDGRQYNEIKRFLEPESETPSPAAGSGWTPGAF